MDRRFQKTDEDFTCLGCGADVSGNGYTNHCPACLMSRHVDVHPGDRRADCLGAMPAIAARRDGKKGIVILHRCAVCGHEKWNRAADNDDVGALADLLALGAHTDGDRRQSPRSSRMRKRADRRR